MTTSKVIKKRFSDDSIAKLLKIKWWDWSADRIAKSLDYIQSGNLSELEKL